MSSKTNAAMIEVFLTTLEAADEQVRREVILRMLQNEDLREDIEAAVLYEERKDEPSRALEDIMADWNDDIAEGRPAEEVFAELKRERGLVAGSGNGTVFRKERSR